MSNTSRQLKNNVSDSFSNIWFYDSENSKYSIFLNVYSLRLKIDIEIKKRRTLSRPQSSVF